MVWKSLVAGLAVPAMLAIPAPASAYSPEGNVSFEIFTETNEVRQENGCAPLRAETDLIVASVQQSSYMAVTRDFSHLGSGGSDYVARARTAGYDQPAGENIAWGYRTATEVMDSWMASAPHRENILNCDARSVGIALRYAADGTPYYTQVFGWT